MSTPRENLRMADLCPSYYEHRAKIEKALNAHDAWVSKWEGMGWVLDDQGWHEPDDWGGWARLLGRPEDNEPNY